MNVALVSLAPVWEDVRASLTLAADRVARAAAAGAELVVLPELTLTGFTMNAASMAEPSASSPTVQAFSSLAREHGVAIAFGVALEGERRPRNTLVVVSRDGAEVARYAKLHPFTNAGEERSYEAGEALVVADVGGVRFGLSICYDLRFGGMYDALADRVDAYLVVANWPAQRISHWTALLRARAIETQAWVLGVNRTGTDGNDLEYPSSTAAYDPRGQEAVLAGVAEDIALVRLSAADVAAYRRSFPVLRDRRPALYGVARGG
jgi:predicted amidohydrolase